MPKIDKDVKELVKHCIQYQEAKVHRHTQSQVMPINAPTRFQTIHIDIVGPLSQATSPDCPYPLLTLTERHVERKPFPL